VDYEVDKYTSAKQYLFEEEGIDGSFILPSLEILIDTYDAEEIQIENFKNEIRKNWGEQES
jgi:hypothetical protein